VGGVVVAVAVLVFAVMFVGCGSSGGDSSTGGGAGGSAGTDSAGVKAAAAEVSAARSVPRFPQLPKGVPCQQLKGKKFFRISYSEEVPYMALVGEGVAEAGKACDVEVTTFDAKAQPAEAAKGIERAISQGYDGIVIDNFSGQQLAAPIAAAKRAGVPVIINNETSGSLPPMNPEVAGTEGFEYPKTAKREAAWVIQDSGGSADVLVFGASGVPGSELMLEAIKQEFADECPECQVTFKEVPVSQWQTQLPTLTATELNRDRNIDYIIPIWDGMVFGVAPGIRNAGATERVKVVTSNGTPEIMEMLANEEIVAADISDPMQWLGWAAFDQLARVSTGQKPIDEKIPSRLFDAENIGEVDVGEGVPAWYEHAYSEGYEHLWGLG
jgi:ribose transport system substrate-binding protein